MVPPAGKADWEPPYALVFVYEHLKKRRYHVTWNPKIPATSSGTYKPKLWDLEGPLTIGLRHTSKRTVSFFLQDGELVFNPANNHKFRSTPDKGQLRFKQDVERTWRIIKAAISASKNGETGPFEVIRSGLGDVPDAEQKARVVAALIRRFNLPIIDIHDDGDALLWGGGVIPELRRVETLIDDAPKS